MKVFLATIAGLGLLIVTAWAQDKGEKDAPQPPAELKGLTEKVSYGLGLDIGKKMKAQGLELDADLFAKGIKDALAGKALLSDLQVREALGEFQKEIDAKRSVFAEKHKKEGEVFLAENKKKPGVTTTASGLQYEVIKPGSGKSPKATDTVSVNYQGTLIDGTEFDSSYKRGEPATFPVNRVIAGWTEALQLMKVGAKWKLFIPSELAYGANPRPGGPIRPNDPLIFDVELLEINPQGGR